MRSSNLRIVRRQQYMAGRCDEGLADPAAFGTPDRNVLQVRIGGGQPSGLGHGLMVGRVYAPRRRVDLLRQFVGVGDFSFARAR